MPKVNPIYHVSKDPIGDLVTRYIKQTHTNTEELSLECGYAARNGLWNERNRGLSRHLHLIKMLVKALCIPEDELIDAVIEYIYGRQK